MKEREPKWAHKLEMSIRIVEINKCWGDIGKLCSSLRSKSMEEKLQHGELLKAIENVLPRIELNISPIEFCKKYILNGFGDFMMDANPTLYLEILSGGIRCPCNRKFTIDSIPRNIKYDSEALTVIRPSGVKLDEYLCFNKKPNGDQLNKSSFGQYSRMFMVLQLIHYVKFNFDKWSRRQIYNVHLIEDDNIYVSVCYYCLFTNRDIFSSETHELSISYWLKYQEYDFFYKHLDYDNLNKLVTKVVSKNEHNERLIKN